MVRVVLELEAYVPGGHACFIPPGQKNPAGQAAAAAEVAVPALQEKPAGQAMQREVYEKIGSALFPVFPDDASAPTYIFVTVVRMLEVHAPFVAPM